MAKIPELSALSALFAFFGNSPVFPADGVDMTHSVGVYAEKYSFQPQAGLNAFLRNDPP